MLQQCVHTSALITRWHSTDARRAPSPISYDTNTTEVWISIKQRNLLRSTETIRFSGNFNNLLFRPTDYWLLYYGKHSFLKLEPALQLCLFKINFMMFLINIWVSRTTYYYILYIFSLFINYFSYFFSKHRSI